jgi:xanthine/CO dehydrogenase XdhC/CoxF family maturation factor
LPEALAKEAAEAGLLASDKIAALLREQLRAERLKRLRGAREKLAADPLPPMTADEIQAEIRAYRAGQRGAPGP